MIRALAGKTLATAESCTGGGIGAALTEVPGASAVYKGGIVSYWSAVKEKVLGVDGALLESQGAVCPEVARQMARGARRLLDADVAVSVTGLAGPGGDDFGNPIGRVYLGYCDGSVCLWEEHTFSGSREDIRAQAVEAALELVLREQR